jgi:hypothetical protein
VVPQGGGIAEAGLVGDGVDGVVTFLEQLLGQQDALPGQPALRCGAGLPDETTGEGALGHVRAGGQLPHGQRLVEMRTQPLEQIPQGAVAERGDGLVDVLRLAAVTMRWHHHPPGDAVGDPGTLFLPDQVQAGVDAGRGARAGDHRIVVDVQHVRVDLGLWIATGQLGRTAPVRGAASSVQQAGLAQDEGSAAHAQYPRAALHRRTEGVEQVTGKQRGRVRTGRHRRLAGPDAQPLVLDRGQRDQVGFGQALQAA